MGGRLTRRHVLRAALVAGLLAPGGLHAQEPRDGDRVTLQGTVVDGDGQPVPGITVLLEAARERFSLRSRENKRGEALQVPTQTDANGAFRFEWTWDRHYNTFTLAFGLEVTREGAPGFEIVERRDVSSEMAGGAPPPLRHELKDAGWLRWLRLYIDGKASDDEKKIYRDLGRPQKLTTDGTATSWWYFEKGKVYRLESGRLDQVIPFDPVREPETGEKDPA
ncbi:MAG: carboxypeptidase-like regulatory domain-containing protein [Acidobacteriota bacterium]